MSLEDDAWLDHVKFIRDRSLEIIELHGYLDYELVELANSKSRSIEDGPPGFIVACAQSVVIAIQILKGGSNGDSDWIAKQAFQLGCKSIQITSLRSFPTLPGDFAWDPNETEMFLNAVVENAAKDFMRKAKAIMERKKQAEKSNLERATRDEHICSLGQWLQESGVKDRNLTTKLIEHCYEKNLWKEYGADPTGLTYPTVRKVLVAGGVIE